MHHSVNITFLRESRSRRFSGCSNVMGRELEAWQKHRRQLAAFMPRVTTPRMRIQWVVPWENAPSAAPMRGFAALGLGAASRSAPRRVSAHRQRYGDAIICHNVVRSRAPSMGHSGKKKGAAPRAAPRSQLAVSDRYWILVTVVPNLALIASMSAFAIRMWVELLG